MSNFIYGKTKEALLNGEIDILNNNLKIILVSQDYVPSINTDQFLSDINSSYIKIDPIILSNVSNTLGVIDADDVLIQNYSGSAFKAIILFIEGTSSSDSRLISYIDTSSGLPFSGTNEVIDITISWNNDSTKIISI